MRNFGANFIQIPVPPDLVAYAALAGATAEAYDYPTGANIIRLSGVTTAAAGFGFAFNPISSAAQWPAADSTGTTASSSLLNIIVPAGESRMFQIPGGSTGFSLVSGTSGIVGIEYWKKGG